MFLTSAARGAVGLGALAFLGRGALANETFSFEWLKQQARLLAHSPFDDSLGIVPKRWRELSHGQYKGITYGSDRSVWKGEGLFELQFFHPGFHYDRTVAINIVQDGEVSAIPFSSDLFDFGDVSLEKSSNGDDLGFAGLRVLYPLDNRKIPTEFLVFLGASYFRLVGREQQYGLSARGLAVDTAENAGEEFPMFREFWIERPAPDATAITIYALLDGNSVTGAFRFVVRPRTASQIGVDAEIYTRRAVDKVGIAPLTSMYFFGENDPGRFDNYRPEVHDSDGLMINARSGEWIWRPLANPRHLRISSFFVDSPKGFGLIQRDLEFASYQDLEADYHRRPSMWIQPRGEWGKGHVELLEIPTDRDSNDNIGCYWVPDRELHKGDSLKLSYVLTAYLDNPQWPPGGRTLATRIGSAREEEPNGGGQGRLIVIDFDGGDLPFLDTDQPVEAMVTTSTGRVANAQVQKNTVTGGWRAMFEFFPDGRGADLRCFLRIRGHALTETWTYLWSA
ncbi:MAG: glucan biosynthesis protein [Gammaproteobacteria bacterium]|nr:glucan biosynthesis protein [Gammaproteobacteria bacterium]